MLKSGLSSLLLLVSLLAYSQPADSLRAIRKPTGLRIGTDLIAIGKTFANTPLTGWELNADVDLGRYYPIVDFGMWKREQTLANGLYNNDGKYFRVGVDINFLLKDPDKNMFFIGFRYGRASYSERVQYESVTDAYGTQQHILTNPSATAGWLELTTGLRVKIWKQFWMGYTARMKFAPGTQHTENFDSYDIPGYGLPFKGLYWGFNYQVFWRVPFKKG